MGCAGECSTCPFAEIEKKLREEKEKAEKETEQ
jgi:hypothetical protein